jgi:hypothetical protein
LHKIITTTKGENEQLKNINDKYQYLMFKKTQAEQKIVEIVIVDNLIERLNSTMILQLADLLTHRYSGRSLLRIDVRETR